MTAITGVLTYTNSAQHLRATPAWIGLAWDDFVYVNDQADNLHIAEEARAWPESEAAGYALFFTPTLVLGSGHEMSHVLAFSSGPDAVEATVMAGRAPAGIDDLLLSPKLAEMLGLGVGDEVEASYDLENITGEPGLTEPYTATVVGIGPVPLADGNFDIGSATTVDGMLAHLPVEATGGPDDREPTSSSWWGSWPSWPSVPRPPTARPDGPRWPGCPPAPGSPHQPCSGHASGSGAVRSSGTPVIGWRS